MKLLVTTTLVFHCLATLASTFPEDEVSRQKRIDKNIDKNRKSDVIVKIKVDPAFGYDLHKLRLRVNQTRASFPLGTAVDAGMIANCVNSGIDDKFCSFARDNFNFGATGNAMKWRYYESNFEEYNTDSPDKTIQWAESNGWGFRGHCIFWDVDDPEHFPDWVYRLGPAEMMTAIYHRLDTAMSHFKGKVLHWDINNEMLHGNFFTEKTGNNDVRIEMFQKAKELDPDTLRFVNDYNVLLYETDGYIKQIRDLIDRGAPVTGIGVQAHLGPNSIDLAKVEKALDDLWNNFQLPIWITEFDWNGDTDGSHGQHAQELTNAYKLFMSHKGVGGILMWGFWDKAHWRPNAAIVNGDNFELNAAGAAYIKLYHETFRTNLELLPELSHDGSELVFRFRGFHGDYNINAVDRNGKVLGIFEQNLQIENNTEIMFEI